MRRHQGQSVTAIVTILFLAIAATATAQTKTSQPQPAATSAQTTTTPSESKAQGPLPPAPLTPQQARLQAQIEKLYQLAQDLKAAVAKSDKDTLSVDVIRKAEAVEKAAKDLKDQMKGSPQPTDHH